MERRQRENEDCKVVELRRPDATHSWGMCYAVLPAGPEIIKIVPESPACGHLRSGQVIKTINGQSVLGLKREDLNELLDIDNEVVVLEVQQAVSSPPNAVLFGSEYGQAFGTPRQLIGQTHRRNSEAATVSERRGSNICGTLPTNLPNCRDEFERIHHQRKQSRELTLSQLERLRIQRAASVDACDGEPSSSSTMPARLPKDLPLKPICSQTLHRPLPGASKDTDKSMASLRYMGVHIPSRSFKALASLMGIDPSGTSIDQQTTQISSKEPCRTVIDVRATAEEMKEKTLRRSSIQSSTSNPSHSSLFQNSSVEAT